ncbi:hypothetical protein PL78_15020 [Yersinia entomophaga]|uniref:Peptidase S14 n=1 Tax=Yersinia entomophaga TaxID=935293 RepID=A0ABM6BNJ8_YERET|nr:MULTISPECIES: ATP-dependent Clp protease proteolytic subunit [Yersinia]ANI31125.1 hypothetical protein PL78_15020 [Yersinia entomophaga]OWF86343.1 hypothetical protein B4914_15135 [Yersinia entomophaga]
MSGILFKTLSVLSLSFLPLQSFADIAVIKKNNIKPGNIEYAKVLYSGDVTENKTVEFISVLDEINANYPKLKKIYVYINSYGGDMDSGYMAYEAIKSSPVPVTTVNLSMVGSSATLFYCAGAERLSMKGASFLLHPAAVANENSNFLKPDALKNMQEAVSIYNNMFDTVYKECTTYTDAERKNILYSENGRALINSGTAIDKKIANGLANGFSDVQISYYITEKPNQ